MKATGIIRKVDDLGRIVIPVELRRALDIDIKDPIEIFTEGKQIILQKYEPACNFCGGFKEITEFHGKKICIDCINELKGVK